MNSVFRKIFYCFTRLVLYGTMKMFGCRSLTLIPFVSPYVGMSMTSSELSALIQNEQHMAVILVRSLHKDTYKHGVYVLYLLYQLFDKPMDFACSFSLYSGIKFVLKHVLVWTLNKNWRVHNYIDPNRISTTLTYLQIDAIEFDKPHLSILFSVCKGILFDMVNYTHILMRLKQWYYTKKTSDVYANIV